MRQLDTHLKRGGSAIIAYAFKLFGEDNGHYIFVPGKSGEEFIVVNPDFWGTTTQFTRKEMVDLLRYRI
jgi:hypothetical protein